MKSKIEITTDTPQYMHKQGWILAGTTTDQTALSEIKRDYLNNGYKHVAFTYGINTIIYWVSLD